MVYEAHDSDYEDEYGLVDLEADDGIGWEEKQQQRRKAKRPAPHREHAPVKETPRVGLPSGMEPVGPEVYYDDLALVNCWEAAILDYKFKHPSQFAPLQEAPTRLLEKQRRAPLWYGPAPVASTSTLPPVHKAGDPASSKKRKAPSHPSAEPPSPAASGVTEASSAISKKKKKRKKTKTVVFTAEDDDGPTYSPKSPDFQRAASPPSLRSFSKDPVPALPSPLLSLPPTASSRPPSPAVSRGSSTPSTTTPGVALPPPASFTPPSIPNGARFVARKYPAPPSHLPREAVDTAGDPATKANGNSDEGGETLLQNALWAWYNAGYQTALYHASLAGESGSGSSA